jgi:transglutaminase-like putative cysteine protease
MLTSTIDTQLSYRFNGPAHVRLALAARQDEGEQSVKDETLKVINGAGSVVPVHWYRDHFGNRVARFDAHMGSVEIRYQAQVVSEAARPFPVRDWPIQELPDEVLGWLNPSRYCESDLLAGAALDYFGNTTPGLNRVQAIVEWVQKNIRYEVGSTHASTKASDVLRLQKGVCRDFAHLCIAFCRALNIPARFVAGYTFFDTPPQDFHAVFEAWLGRWVRFDPTGLAPTERLVRIAVGRDAKDTAFATCWGSMFLTRMRVDITQVDEANGTTWVGDNSIQVVG